MKRTKIIYGNYKVYHPDGTLMFLCEFKKANWYLKRNLAKKLTENEIQLTFIPKGKGRRSEYDLSEKKNICVVCCDDELSTLTKHHVVPYQYRKFFPYEIKSRSSHDILPICQKHHYEYENVYANKLKLELEEKYDIKRKKISLNLTESFKIQKYSNLLLDYEKCKKLPKDRIRFFLSEMERVFNTNDPFEVSKLKIYDEVDKEIDMISKTIVDNLNSIEDFEIMWRKHFVENMKPKYLPKGWSIHGIKHEDETNECPECGCCNISNNIIVCRKCGLVF